MRKTWSACAVFISTFALGAAQPLSLAVDPVGLSVNAFVNRFGAADRVETNPVTYSHILYYQSNTSGGLSMRAYFKNGACVSLMGRLATPIPVKKFVSDEVLTRIMRREYQRLPDGGSVRLGTEDFDHYWFLELNMPTPKALVPETEKAANPLPDFSQASIIGFAYGDKADFMEMVHQAPELGFISSENYFHPGATLPSTQPGQ